MTLNPSQDNITPQNSRDTRHILDDIWKQARTVLSNGMIRNHALDGVCTAIAVFRVELLAEFPVLACPSVPQLEYQDDGCGSWVLRLDVMVIQVKPFGTDRAGMSPGTEASCAIPYRDARCTASVQGLGMD